MDIHHWADWAVIAQALLAFVAAWVAYWQIRAAQSESKKWNLLIESRDYFVPSVG
jgi:hypothetical protein